MQKNLMLKTFVLWLLVATGITSFSMHGMKRALDFADVQKREFFEELKNGVPFDVRQEIMKLVLKNAIFFLNGSQLVTTTSRAHNDQVSSVVIRRNVVMTGSWDKTVKIWDISNNKFELIAISPSQFNGGHIRGINSVVADCDRVVTGSMDSHAILWNIHDSKFELISKTPSQTLGHTNWIRSVAMNGNLVVTGSDDKTAKLWDISTGQFKLVATTPEGYNNGDVGHVDAIMSTVIQDNRVVTVSADKTIKIWNIQNNYFELSLTISGGHDFIIRSVAIQDDKIVTGSDDNTAKIWDINTGQLLHILKGHSNMVNSVSNMVNSVAIQGDKIATGSWGGTIKVWDINTGELLHTLEDIKAIHSVAIADDKIVAGYWAGRVSLWSFLLDLSGTIHINPIKWICESSNMQPLQANFIHRAYKATIDNKDLIIDLPEKLNVIQEDETQSQRDGRIYFSFPEHVRKRLRDKLNIKK